MAALDIDLFISDLESKLKGRNKATDKDFLSFKEGN